MQPNLQPECESGRSRTEFKSNSNVQMIRESRSGLHSASMIIHMSWAQIRLAAYSQGSRPSAEVPETIYPLHPQPIDH